MNLNRQSILSNVIIYNEKAEIALTDLNNNTIDSIVTDPPAGIEFAGEKWDSDKGGREEWILWLENIMKEAYRVLKPGGHALVWAIPRTSHWTATAVENAGFELRDKIIHVYGSGFPKNLDLSKAIDKKYNATREVVGKYQPPNGQQWTLKQDDNPDIPHVKGMFSGTRNLDITAPVTDDAKKWDGWGTALKPAIEEWLLFRKPLEKKTVIENVLEYGTGAINIKDSRVDSYGPGEFEKLVKRVNSPRTNFKDGNFVANNDKEKIMAPTSMTPEGRYPSNFIMSHSVNCDENACSEDCPIKTINEQVTNDKKDTLGVSRYYKNFYPEYDEYVPFYYVPKPSSKEKDAGLQKSFIETGEIKKEKRQNTHLTVKSISLMEYLCKLITPVDGTVLDPFMGSGSTGCAAVKNGFGFIGIEQSQEFCEISKDRIIYWWRSI